VQALVVVVVVVVGAFPKALLLSRPQNKGPTKQQCFFYFKERKFVLLQPKCQPSIGTCSKGDDHDHKSLAKFGYNPDMKYKSNGGSPKTKFKSNGHP